MKRIDDLTGEAYEIAIKQMATVLNAYLGTKLTYREDWAEIDALTRYLNVEFNENGQMQ